MYEPKPEINIIVGHQTTRRRKDRPDTTDTQQTVKTCITCFKSVFRIRLILIRNLLSQRVAVQLSRPIKSRVSGSRKSVPLEPELKKDLDEPVHHKSVASTAVPRIHRTDRPTELNLEADTDGK